MSGLREYIFAPDRGHAKGLTLLEVVLTLVILGFMGTMLTVMGTRIMQNSLSPAVQTQHMYSLRQVMENINLDYATLVLEQRYPLCELAARILPEDSDPATKYGKYKSTIRFVRPSNAGSKYFLVPTNVPINYCKGHSPHSDVGLLEVVLFPYDSDGDVQIRSLFAAPE